MSCFNSVLNPTKELIFKDSKFNRFEPIILLIIYPLTILIQCWHIQTLTHSAFLERKCWGYQWKFRGYSKNWRNMWISREGGGLFRKLKFSGGTVNLTWNPLKRKISSTGKGDTNSKEQTIQQNKNKNKKFWQSPIRWAQLLSLLYTWSWYSQKSAVVPSTNFFSIINWYPNAGFISISFHLKWSEVVRILLTCICNSSVKKEGKIIFYKTNEIFAHENCFLAKIYYLLLIYVDISFLANFSSYRRRNSINRNVSNKGETEYTQIKQRIYPPKWL